MGKFSESSYNILNEYFGIIKESSGVANSYLIGPRKTIVAKGGVVTHLYEKRETGELIGYKFRITEISGNNFKFEYKGLLRDHSLAVDDFTVGSEMYFRKDAFFHDWLNVNSALYRDDVNTNRTYIYFGKIYEVPNETDTYSIVFEGMKDHMSKALPENNRTTKLEEFLKVYFDQVHHSVYNMTKNLWSLLDPKEIDIRFLNLIALDYGIEIDDDLPESNLREWVETIIYFLKRKGDYASIYIIFKLLLGNTENNLNIYERWAEWCSSELSDTPSFENDHHILEYYNEQPAGGAGTDYYSQYTPTNYPSYTTEAPSGDCLKDIFICGSTKNYNTFSGTDTGNDLTVVDRASLRITDFDASTSEIIFSSLSTTPSGNLLHCVKTNLSSDSSSGAGIYMWGLGNEDLKWNDYTTSNWLGISLGWYVDAYEFNVSEGYNNGSTVQSQYSSGGYSTDTDYYLVIERLNNDLSLYIFNDDERSNLLETVTLNLSGGTISTGAFSYLFALNTFAASGTSVNWSGDIYNLATGAVSASGINQTDNLVLTPHYKIELDLSNEPVGDNYIINEYLMDELIRYWDYTKPVSKYAHYEQLVAPTCTMNEIGEYNSLYDETENAFLNTQFTGTSFLSAAVPTAPSGTSIGSGTYTYKQTMSSYTWVINHGLGTRDFVFQAYDHNRELIKPKDVEITTENRITLIFDNAARGEAYIAKVRNNYDYLHTETTQRTSPVLELEITSETVSSGNISGSTFIDVNSESDPFVSYYDYGTDKVKYATKVSDVWVSEEVDDCDGNNTIKIDIDNLGISHIAYNYDNDDIVYANNSTSSWVPVIVGSDGVNGHVVLVIDSLNNPHVIYSAETVGGTGILQHAIKSGGLWSYDTIDTSPSGNYKDMSVVIDSDNYIYVSYVDDYIGELKVADGSTNSWSVTATGVSGASYTSIVLDSQNNAHVVYKNTSNEYKHITNNTGSFVTYTIDSTVGSGFEYTSLGMDDSDNLHTIYNSNSGTELRYGKFDTTAWTGWATALISQTPSGTQNMGFSIKIDDFNNLHSTYSEYTSASSNLKYITLTSSISGYTAFDWTVNHSLASSGASGIIAQYYNNDYTRKMMIPVSQVPTSDDIMTATWNTADAYRGTAPVRRIDYTWDSTEGAANIWNFDTSVDGFTSTNADIYATSAGTMRMIPTNWDYGETAEPEIRRTGLNFAGADNSQVTARIKVRDASNSWVGSLYWTNALHGESELFYSNITNNGDANYDWQIVEWDVSREDDWTNNNITGIRFDMQHDDYTYNPGLLLNTDNVSFGVSADGRSYEDDGSFCRVEGLNFTSYTTPDNQAIKVTIDSSLIDETLTNFPVMVNVSTSAGTGSYDTAKIFEVLDTDDKKNKLKVTNVTGTVEYFCERTVWDVATETGIIWVKIPTISSTTDTEFLLTWNLSGSDAENMGDIGSAEAQNVWSDNFAGVWHMGQNPSGGIIYDSTINELHGTPSAAASGSNYVDGLIGKAYKFTGVDEDIINIGIQSELIFGNDTSDDAFSIELLSNSASISAGTEAVYEDSSYKFDSRSPSGAHFKLSDGTASLDAYTTTLSGYADQWLHQIATYDGSGNSTGLKIYVAGSDATSSTSETGTYVAMSSTIDGDGFMIGHDMYDVEQTFDEIRVHSTERSAAWVKASKNSQYDTLLSYEDGQQRRTHALRLLDTSGLEASGWIGGSDDVETLGNNIEVVSITKSTSGNPGLLTVTGSAGIPSGALVKFNGLTEMTELNGGYSTVSPFIPTAADYTGRWDDHVYGNDITPWQNESITSHMIYNDELYVGTGWQSSQTASAGRMLKWDGGSDWTEIASTPTASASDRLYALCSYNNKIYTVTNGRLYEYDEAGGWTLKADKYYYSGVGYADFVYDLVVYEGRLFGSTRSIDFTHSGVLLRWNDVDAWELAADRYTTSSGYRDCQKLFIYNDELYGSVSSRAVKWDEVMGNNWIDTGVSCFYDHSTDSKSIAILNGVVYNVNYSMTIYAFNGTSNDVAYTIPGTTAVKGLWAYNGDLYYAGYGDRLYRVDLDAQENILVAYYDGTSGGEMFTWNNSIWSLGATNWLASWTSPYEIRDTSQYALAESTGGNCCNQVLNVGTDGAHIFSSSTTVSDQSWAVIEDGFNWNDTSYTVLVTSTVVTGEFEWDWIMISNVPATWNINHNLNAGGLIVECFDDQGEVMNPEGVTLTSANSASIYWPGSTTGSANLIYFPRTFVIETDPDDISGVGIGENLGYWKIGNGTRQEYNPIGANDIQSITLSGSFDSVYENAAGTHIIIEFVISSLTDITITEIGLFNEDRDIMFYTLCSPLFKPAGINLRMFYRIEKTE